MMKMIRVGLMMAVVAGGACAVTCPPPVKAQMAIAAVVGGDPQVKDELFAGTEKFAQGASDVTEVNLDKNMLGMVSKGKDALAGKMDFVVVHSYTYDKPGMYKMEDVDVFRKRLTDGSWNCFVHTRDKDGATDVCMRTMSDNETHEMVVMTAEAKELTFVHLRGRMSLDDLGKMGNSVGVPTGGRHAIAPLPPPPPPPPAPR
jgi:hypothetical protein